MPRPPLSTPLSQLLVAYTIEFDNEFEHRLAQTGLGRRFGLSMVMWSNFLRFVGDGVSVGDLTALAGLPKARVLSALGGMERWRYVFVGIDPTGPPPESKREGWGSARGLRPDWTVRPTPAGVKAQEIWPPLFDDVDGRWEERFGSPEIGELRRSLSTLVNGLGVELPDYLPIVTGSNGMAAEIAPRDPQGGGARDSASDRHLSALLAKALLAYTLDFERESELSLALYANFLRVLETDLDVRDTPAAAGVSKEATSMALTYLTKQGYVDVDSRTKLARLTAKGRDARKAASGVHANVERAWTRTFGDEVERLRTATAGVLDQRDGRQARLSLGLEPYPDGWRATKPYLEQTTAVLADPRARLPHYPLVLHRGGWPDGS